MKITQDENTLINIDILQALKFGEPEIVYKGSKGILIIVNDTQLISFEAEKDIPFFDNLLKTDKIIVAHQSFYKYHLLKQGFQLLNPCYQASYYKNPFSINLPENVEIKALTDDELEYAHKYYHKFVDIDYIQNRIDNKVIWGVFTDGLINGFIGIHSSGAMGMLEIDKNFRRKGLATYLEEYLINFLLMENKVPYCQIVEGNNKSLLLQKKLGFSFAKGRIYWMKKN